MDVKNFRRIIMESVYKHNFGIYRFIQVKNSQISISNGN